MKTQRWKLRFYRRSSEVALSVRVAARPSCEDTCFVVTKVLSLNYGDFGVVQGILHATKCNQSMKKGLKNEL